MADKYTLDELFSIGQERKVKDEFKTEMTHDLESWIHKAQPKFTYQEEEDEPESTEIQKMVDTVPEETAKPEITKRLHIENDVMLITSVIKGVHPFKLKAWQAIQTKQTEFAKALATTVSGSGLEWLPTRMSATFIQEMTGEFKLASQFPHLTIPLGVHSIEIPGGDGNIQFYKRTDTSSDDIAAYTASTPSTRKVTLTPVEFAARVLYSSSMQEDAIRPVAERIRGNMINGCARTIDVAIMNGDTDLVSPIDSDLTSTADPRNAWEGLRALTTSVANQDASDTVSIATIRKVWQSMETNTRDYSDEDDLMLNCNKAGYLRLMSLAEVLTNDKFGIGTIKSGKLTHLFGVPIVKCAPQVVRRDLNVSGIYDGTTTTATHFQLANKKAFIIGDKRKVTVEVDKDIDTGEYHLVATVRMCFKNLHASTEPATATLYNILKAS